jgi:hypothetical protein
MKPFVLTTQEWEVLKTRLQEDYPRSVFLSRDKMRRVLGFTPREHRDYNKKFGYMTSIYLDFYEEKHRTMFLLKYGNGKD